MRLYHRTDRESARAILGVGFVDGLAVTCSAGRTTGSGCGTGMPVEPGAPLPCSQWISTCRSSCSPNSNRR
jgi:hypothetical protein